MAFDPRAVPTSGGSFDLPRLRAAARSFPSPGCRSAGFNVGGPRAAACLVPMLDLGGRTAVVLTRRAPTMRHHRNDWVFPGGRADPERDGSAEDTARREAAEELGINEARLEVIGQLDSCGPIITGFVVDVFVGIVDRGIELCPDPREVAEVAVVPLEEFLVTGAFQMMDDYPADHDPGPLRGPLPAPGERSGMRSFTCASGVFLWGLQADILWNLFEVVADHDRRVTGGERR